MTITLPNEIENLVRSAAVRSGVDADTFVTQLIVKHLPTTAIDQATIDLLNQWSQEDKTDDPAEIQRRREQFTDFAKSLNESSGRVIYP